MKRFAFNLQNLLTLRAHRKEEAARAWMKALYNLQVATTEAGRARTNLNAWHETQREQRMGPVLACDLIRNQQTAQQFYTHWVLCERLRRATETRASQALENWHEARRKEEILKRLKNRSWTNWLSRREKEEQKINDERASIQAFRRLKQQPAIPR
jgi:flagellar biosynthesis chaperone FliJ